MARSAAGNLTRNFNGLFEFQLILVEGAGARNYPAQGVWTRSNEVVSKSRTPQILLEYADAYLVGFFDLANCQKLPTVKIITHKIRMSLAISVKRGVAETSVPSFLLK